MNTNDHASAVADMQRRGMQGALAFGRATTGMFERLARQNYAVMGDVVDYTLTQLRIPTVHADARSALEAQAAGTRAAVEKARVRATEYAAIAGEIRDVAGSVASTTAASAAAVSAKSGPKSGPKSGLEPAPATSPTTADTGTKAAGGSPIIVPGDSPKAVARKSIRAADAVAVEASATRTVVKADAKRAGKAAAKGTARTAKGTAKAASKRTAAKATAKKPAAKQTTARKTVGKTASKAGAKKRPTPARGTRVKKG